MSNDNKTEPGKPTLRVVGNETSEAKKELISHLRSAIELVEKEDCIGVMVSLVRSNGDLINIISGTEHRHMMVAAALYQLLDVAGVNESKSL